MARPPLTIVASTSLGSEPVKFKLVHFLKWLDCKEIREYNIPMLLKELSEFTAYEEQRQKLNVPIKVDLDTYKSKHTPCLPGSTLSSQEINWNTMVLNRLLNYLGFKTRFGELNGVEDEVILFEAKGVTYDIRGDDKGFTSKKGNLLNVDWDTCVALLVELKEEFHTGEVEKDGVD